MRMTAMTSLTFPRFLEKLREGYDLVMGNRFRGGIRPGAMPALHRYFGNPLLSLIGRLFFRAPCRDFHCGLRAFRKEAIVGLDLRTTGMEFASEMVVRAVLFGLRIAEVPTTLSPDGRTRPPHLRRSRDGWRHLRFLLMYSPRWLFLISRIGAPGGTAPCSWPGCCPVRGRSARSLWTCGQCCLRRSGSWSDSRPCYLQSLDQGLRDDHRVGPRDAQTRETFSGHHAGSRPDGGRLLTMSGFCLLFAAHACLEKSVVADH